MNKKIRNYIVPIISLVIFLGACATTSEGGPGGSVSGSGGAGKAERISDSPLYFGTGTGNSQSAALNSAKLNAVKKAVIDALGKASSLANRENLEDKVYGKINVNALVYNDTLDILNKSSDGGEYTVTAGVRINLPAVADALRGAEIYGGLILPQGEMLFWQTRHRR